MTLTAFIMGVIVMLCGLTAYAGQKTVRAAWQAFAVIFLGCVVMLFAAWLGVQS